MGLRFDKEEDCTCYLQAPCRVCEAQKEEDNAPCAFCGAKTEEDCDCEDLIDLYDVTDL